MDKYNFLILMEGMKISKCSEFFKGGQDMSNFKNYVPEDLHLFYEIVGEKAYEEVVRFYGGSSIYIPTLESHTRNDRNQMIYEEYCKGVSFKELALKWGLSVNAIRSIVYKIRKEGKK